MSKSLTNKNGESVTTLAGIEKVGTISMMRLKVEKVGEGLHPNETVVTVQTKDGPVVMVVDPTIIHADCTVVVGWPVDRKLDSDLYLVELPRETEHGSWRVWVASKELLQTEERKRA